MFPLLKHGFVYGLILSGLLTTLLFATLAWNPAIMVGDYPPDIRAKFGPPDARAQRQKRLVAVPFLGATIGVFAWAVAAMPAAGLPQTFANVFIVGFVVAFVFNLFDLLIIDWLIVVTWRPRLIVLPGTENLPGYRDYAFHFRGFLIGLGFCFVAALLAAVLNALVQLIV